MFVKVQGNYLDIDCIECVTNTHSYKYDDDNNMAYTFNIYFKNRSNIIGFSWNTKDCPHDTAVTLKKKVIKIRDMLVCLRQKQIDDLDDIVGINKLN